MTFFDRHPRFYDTTGTKLRPNRFAQRYKAIIDSNRALLRGARVLDLASHDGRWSMAALDAGARSVEGVEGRRELVTRAVETFEHYAVAKERYRFHCGDVVDFLRNLAPGSFDVVMCLGFLYHTMHHMEILQRIAASRAGALIIDTGVDRSPEPIISISKEDTEDFRNAIGDASGTTRLAPVGSPSRAALAMMLEYLGYGLEEVDWPRLVDDWSECEDYKEGYRGTFVSRRTASGLVSRRAESL